MRIVTALLGIVLITILALAVVSRADTKPKPAPPPLTSSALYEAECGSAWRAVRFYRSKVAQHRTVLGVGGLPPVEENANCVRLRDRAGYWRGNAYRHAQVVAKRTLPFTNDWRTSVRLAQRPFPGTSTWLLFISAREGGYGPFVMNHQGSGAGGWMQFMSGTFYAYVDDARAAVERRGFIVPAHVWKWTHPLGQALTAGYMRYTGRDGCHWCL
jgi:hypothetical protein